jgi:hypothetical protein
MGTLLFVVLWTLGYREVADDYQHLCMLVSLDTIAGAIYLHYRRGSGDGAA